MATDAKNATMKVNHCFSLFQPGSFTGLTVYWSTPEVSSPLSSFGAVAARRDTFFWGAQTEKRTNLLANHKGNVIIFVWQAFYGDPGPSIFLVGGPPGPPVPLPLWFKEGSSIPFYLV